jgi:hypothetical protein
VLEFLKMPDVVGEIISNNNTVGMGRDIHGASPTNRVFPEILLDTTILIFTHIAKGGGRFY